LFNVPLEQQPAARAGRTRKDQPLAVFAVAGIIILCSTVAPWIFFFATSPDPWRELRQGYTIVIEYVVGATILALLLGALFVTIGVRRR
jgi:hypothetical protein